MRHADNHNLELYGFSSYMGCLVMSEKGPLIKQYLDSLYVTIHRALVEHPRTLAIRFDLHFPQEVTSREVDFSNAVLRRFFKSLKSIIRHDRQRASEWVRYAHQTSVRYVWAREISKQTIDQRPHFHVLLLLNRDAYHTLGGIQSPNENLYWRIHRAWCNALGYSGGGSGIVHIPVNSVYYLDAGDLEAFAAVFYRGSYLCKSETKSYGDGQHSFGSSHI